MFKVSFYHVFEKKSYSFDVDSLSISNNCLFISVVSDFYSYSYKKFRLFQIVGLSVSYVPVA